MACDPSYHALIKAAYGNCIQVQSQIWSSATAQC